MEKHVPLTHQGQIRDLWGRRFLHLGIKKKKEYYYVINAKSGTGSGRASRRAQTLQHELV